VTSGTVSWESESWPIEAAGEISSQHFEDLRKRIWLLSGWPFPHWQSAGFNDYSGWKIRTHTNWGDSPFLATDQPAHPGSIKTFFKNPKTELIRLYSNYYYGYKDAINPDWESDACDFQMDTFFDLYEKAGNVWLNCPVNPDGSVNPNWREIPTGNKYHHFDRNSGKWLLHHSSGNTAYTCSPYDVKLPAYKWLPRQTDPYEQVVPVKDDDACRRRFFPVEFAKRHITKGSLAPENITGTIGGEWNRAYDPEDIPAEPNGWKGIWPEKNSPYIVDDPHPFDSRLAGLNLTMFKHSYKLSTAYQEWVLAVAEIAGKRFVLPVDDDWIAQWKKRKKEEAVDWQAGTTYYPGDIKVNDGEYYTCYVENIDVEPGVHADWQDYWLVGVYHPDRVPQHPSFENFLDEYWNCNCSAFELSLKIIGEYDWYWDPQTPTMNLGVHRNRLDAFRLGNPTSPFPEAVGCWRRTWKHSMGRVRLQDGTYAKMWPQDMGDPNDYFGITKGQYLVGSQYIYDGIYSEFKHFFEVIDINTMAQKYNKALSQNEQKFINLSQRHDPVQTEHVQDEGEFVDTSIAIRWRPGMIWPENYPVEHHGVYYKLLKDVIVADVEPPDAPETYKPMRIPEYELHHDLVNNMREMLVLFKYVDAEEWITGYTYQRFQGGTHNQPMQIRPSRLDALNYGEERVNAVDLLEYKWISAGGGGYGKTDFADCGYELGSTTDSGGYVVTGIPSGEWYYYGDTDIPGIGQMAGVIVYSEDYPKIFGRSHLAMKVCYRAYTSYPSEDRDTCLLGFADITFKPDKDDDTVYFAYADLGPHGIIEESFTCDPSSGEGTLRRGGTADEPITERYSGTEWQAAELYKTELLSPWPHKGGESRDWLLNGEPDPYGGLRWSRETIAAVALDAHLPYIIEIDWNIYSDAPEGDVFELDCENAVEFED